MALKQWSETIQRVENSKQNTPSVQPVALSTGSHIIGWLFGYSSPAE